MADGTERRDTSASGVSLSWCWMGEQGLLSRATDSRWGMTPNVSGVLNVRSSYVYHTTKTDFVKFLFAQLDEKSLGLARIMST